MDSGRQKQRRSPRKLVLLGKHVAADSAQTRRLVSCCRFVDDELQRHLQQWGTAVYQGKVMQQIVAEATGCRQRNTRDIERGVPEKLRQQVLIDGNFDCVRHVSRYGQRGST